MRPSFDIILASASPRRRKLLEDAGVEFTVRTAEAPVDERVSDDLAANPIEAAKVVAERKAGAMIQELLAEKPIGGFIIIGADTMVSCEGRLFGKPESVSDAKHMLRCLSGRTHDVVTGVSVWMLSAQENEKVSIGHRTFAETTHVRFKALSPQQISDYLATGEAFDKAGAYGIQGAAADFVAEVRGDRDNVIGLPVTALLASFPILKTRKARR